MLNASLLDKILAYDKDNIHPEILKKLKRYVENPEFQPAYVKKASKAASSMCQWIHSLYLYCQIAQELGPKKAKLCALEAKLAKCQAATCPNNALDRSAE